MNRTLKSPIDRCKPLDVTPMNLTTEESNAMPHCPTVQSVGSLFRRLSERREGFFGGLSSRALKQSQGGQRRPLYISRCARGNHQAAKRKVACDTVHSDLSTVVGAIPSLLTPAK